MEPFIPLALGTVVVVFVVFALLGRGGLRAVETHQALVIQGVGGTRVRFTPTLVLPMVQRAEIIDLSTQVLALELTGHAGLRCQDKIRADVTARVLIRVNRTAEDVLKVAQSVGCARAARPETVRELFEAKVIEAFRTVFAQLQLDELTANIERLRDEIIEVIGYDLNGYTLEDLSIEQITQTPTEDLDPGNVEDAEAIRRIAERTHDERLRAAELQHRTALEVAQQNLRAAEQMAELERVRKEAELRAQMEIRRMEAEAELATAKARAAEEAAAGEAARAAEAVRAAEAKRAAAEAEADAQRSQMTQEQQRDYDKAVAAARAEYEKQLAAAEARRAGEVDLSGKISK